MKAQCKFSDSRPLADFAPEITNFNDRQHQIAVEGT